MYVQYKKDADIFVSVHEKKCSDDGIIYSLLSCMWRTPAKKEDVNNWS